MTGITINEETGVFAQDLGCGVVIKGSWCTDNTNIEMWHRLKKGTKARKVTNEEPVTVVKKTAQPGSAVTVRDQDGEEYPIAPGMLALSVN